jgi:hypothetical protein
VNLVWYAPYSGGGGIISGRCMKQRAEGQSNLGNGAYCGNTFWSGGYFRSPISICSIPYPYYISFSSSIYQYGGIPQAGYSYANRKCTNSMECPAQYTACMNIDGDSYKKCTPLPTLFYLIQGYLTYSGFNSKSSYGQPCNLYYKCNEFKNLKCTNYYANTTAGAVAYGTCTCYGKYQYWNATVTTGTTAYGWGMCINGKRF